MQRCSLGIANKGSVERNHAAIRNPFHRIAGIADASVTHPPMYVDSIIIFEFVRFFGYQIAKDKRVLR
jgi:hypothetical protein